MGLQHVEGLGRWGGTSKGSKGWEETQESVESGSQEKRGRMTVWQENLGTVGWNVGSTGHRGGVEVYQLCWMEQGPGEAAWVREGYKGVGGEFSLGDQRPQCFLWVRNQETKLYEVREEGVGGLRVLRKGGGAPSCPLPSPFAYIHQGRITIPCIFQRTISLRVKKNTNDNYTGIITGHVETVPGKPGPFTMLVRQVKPLFFLQEAFLDNYSPHGLPLFLAL